MKSEIKQNLVLGTEFLTDIRKLKVLLINMNWTSIEIAWNLCLLNIGHVTLFDKSLVIRQDLSLPFLFKPEHIDQPKIDIVKNWLTESGFSTKIEKNYSDVCEVDVPLKEHDIIILTDVNSYVFLKKTEDHCMKHSKKFIYVSTNEFYAAALFNFVYIESKVRFNHITNIDVESITYAKEGIIKLYNKHPFQKGDFVTIEGLEDTKGFSNDEIRPVVRVIDDSSFEIEDTSMYTDIGPIQRGSAFVCGVNFPMTHRFKPVQLQLYLSEKEFAFFNPKLQRGFRYIMPYLKFRDLCKSGNFENKKQAYEQLYKDENLKDWVREFQEFIISRDIEKPKRMIPLENSLIAGLVSFEILKTNGLYLPNKAPVFLSSLNMDFIFEQNIMIFGCGAKTHELLKILLIECQIRQKEFTVSVFDDNVITTDHSKRYFFANHTNVNLTKSAGLAKEINSLKCFLKVKEIDRAQNYKAVSKADLVFITFDSYLTAYDYADMTICIKKPLFLITEYLGEFYSIYLTDQTLSILENYYVNTNDFKKVNRKGLDVPESSPDVAKWTGFLFEFLFEHFIIEGDLFKNNPRDFPFYFLIMFLKGQFYEFLLNQSPKESNIIAEGIIIFKIIFNWYISLLINSHDSDRMQKFEEIQPLDFDFENQMHQEFIISFVGVFKGIFVPSSPKMDSKTILENLMLLKKDIRSRLPDFTHKQIEENYKLNLKKIIKSEKYFRTYKIRHQLIEF